MALTQRTAGHGIQAQFSIDTSQVDARLKMLIEIVEPEFTNRGLFAAGNELLADARDTGPQAPKETGDLWRSARTTKAEISGSGAEILAGFNIVYAAKWHEVPLGKKINWTTNKGASQPGPKYLESKLLINRDKYMKIIADFLATGMKVS
jgi:hypothetical protein